MENETARIFRAESLGRGNYGEGPDIPMGILLNLLPAGSPRRPGWKKSSAAIAGTSQTLSIVYVG